MLLPSDKERAIFISSCYTHGDREENVRAQIVAFHELRDKGWQPFAPLLSHYIELYRERPYKDWLEWCLAWIMRCDSYCQLPLHSPSTGAEIEKKAATLLRIPKYYGGTGWVPEVSRAKFNNRDRVIKEITLDYIKKKVGFFDLPDDVAAYQEIGVCTK